MGASRNPISDSPWKAVEEMYLGSATESQRTEYAGMTTGEKWGVLKPFLLSHSKTKHPNKWMKLAIEQFDKKAKRE